MHDCYAIFWSFRAHWSHGQFVPARKHKDDFTEADFIYIYEYWCIPIQHVLHGRSSELEPVELHLFDPSALRRLPRVLP